MQRSELNAENDFVYIKLDWPMKLNGNTNTEAEKNLIFCYYNLKEV